MELANIFYVQIWKWIYFVGVGIIILVWHQLHVPIFPSKHEEKTTYENIHFNPLAIEKEEKQANNISAVNLIPKNKIDAQAIILLEIKRLSFSLKKLEKNKIKLELKVKFKMNK